MVPITITLDTKIACGQYEMSEARVSKQDSGRVSLDLIATVDPPLGMEARIHVDYNPASIGGDRVLVTWGVSPAPLFGGEKYTLRLNGPADAPTIYGEKTDLVNASLKRVLPGREPKGIPGFNALVAAIQEAARTLPSSLAKVKGAPDLMLEVLAAYMGAATQPRRTIEETIPLQPMVSYVSTL